MSTDPGSDVASLARETGFSDAAVEAMRRSVVRGGGRMAQFDHRDFGGPGQWMQGGMLMIGDPSDQDLKRRIDRLCDALSAWIDGSPVDVARDPQPAASQSQHQGQTPETADADAAGRRVHPSWYPAALGTPDSSGSQNDLRYAWFASARRLAVDRHGAVTLYDTGDHRIGGVSQQQGIGRTLSFTSQHGDVDLDRLPVVVAEPVASAAVSPETTGTIDTGRPTSTRDASDPFVALEKLAGLHARGILDDQEFAGKKSELLKRI